MELFITPLKTIFLIKEERKMFEFELYNETTGETTIIFGYSLGDAKQRWGIEDPEWECIRADYVD